jgi:hypothetical protein
VTAIVTRPTTEDVRLSLTEDASQCQPNTRDARRRPEEGRRALNSPVGRFGETRAG